MKMTLFWSWLLTVSAISAVASGNDWMASMDGDLLLSQLSIPGSHDTMALFEPFSGTTRCQELPLADQLAAGVRFVDIRCRHVNNTFAIYHGMIDQKASFDDVLNACVKFLSSHSSECIVMSVKEEYTPDRNTRTFEQTFGSYVSKNPNIWHLGSGIPSLGSVRGKIVLFRRFDAKAQGIDASVWPDNTTFTNHNLTVEDHYELLDNNTKWTDITNLFSGSLRGSAEMFYVTFASGYKKSALGIPNIPTVADDINSRLANYFNAHDSGRYGIVLMDFVDAHHCSQIIATDLNRRMPLRN